MRNVAALVVCLLAACGVEGAPGTRDFVTPSGVYVVVDPDVPFRPDNYAKAIDAYRAEYETRWGAVNLTGWTIHMVSATHAPVVDGTRRVAAIYGDTLTIVLGPPTLQYLPHELHHVQTGGGHAGWCLDYVPWELTTVGVDERAYLGCP
jgi:hypothetical protein